MESFSQGGVICTEHCTFGRFIEFCIWFHQRPSNLRKRSVEVTQCSEEIDIEIWLIITRQYHVHWPNSVHNTGFIKISLKLGTEWSSLLPLKLWRLTCESVSNLSWIWLRVCLVLALRWTFCEFPRYVDFSTEGKLCTAMSVSWKYSSPAFNRRNIMQG